MEMPDKIYLFPDVNSIGDLGFTITYPKESWDGRDYIEYTKSSTVAELEAKLQRWEDAHSEMIGEVELRKRVAELEAIIEARGM